MVTKKHKLQEVYHGYYKDLYSEPGAKASVIDREYVMDNIPLKFNQGMNKSLSRPISTTELRSAANIMASEGMCKLYKLELTDQDKLSVQV
jgi:hypothetical protein